MAIRKSSNTGIPFGNTAGRPAAQTGQPYFNGETARLELYTGAGWQNIVQETPGITSISGAYLESAGTGTITISGTNFLSGALASAVGTNGVEVNASSTTFNSIVQLTAVFAGLSSAHEPYDIKVTNPSNLFGIIPDALHINNNPTWNTAAGSLGTFDELVAISISATATDDSIITYSLASGSSLPSGVTLNSSTGLISGNLPDISSDTTYTFTINASDGSNPAVPRTFSITSLALLDIDYLVVGGGGGGGYDNGGGGGGGGLRSSVDSTGGGGSPEPKFLAALATNYSVSVGIGGRGTSDTLSSSVLSSGGSSTFATITALGGGKGGTGSAFDGASGGSGGGSKRGGAGGAGTPGQGLSGGSGVTNITGGGGGGAGQAGSNGSSASGGSGGNGLSISITGSSVYYAGGGGGGYESGSNNNGGLGGLGGGGKGGARGATTLGVNGTDGLGGGGGGTEYSGGSSSTEAGKGGSGIVILRYPSARTLNVGAGLTSTTATVDGNKVTSFTAGSGTVTFS